MKKTAIISVILWVFGSAYSQDYFDNIAKQAIEIDSLLKIIQSELITNLEREKNNNEALENICNSYKNKSFDELIKSSTQKSIERDKKYVDNNEEVKLILSDLEKYFEAEELLTKKMDADQIKNVQTELSQINRQSALLDNLKNNLKFYKNYVDELKKTIQKLITLDNQKVAAGDKEQQEFKFKEIIFELSDYLYNFYDYGNYPYLSDIILEIIKRKKFNADADISDLLNN